MENKTSGRNVYREDDPDYLRSCKKCGGKAVVLSDGENYPIYQWVECENGHKSGCRNNRESAIKLWNKENK